MIRLLDCAFLFFSNYPCKLAFSELEHDLPCENAVFNAKHPFAEENFRFRRGSTTAEAFEELFREQSNPPPAQRQCDVESCVNYGSRTVVDLFLTIHCKLAHSSTAHLARVADKGANSALRLYTRKHAPASSSRRRHGPAAAEPGV